MNCRGLLYQLTGEKQYAEKAKEQVTDIIDKKRHDEKDTRYGFSNPAAAVLCALGRRSVLSGSRTI